MMISYAQHFHPSSNINIYRSALPCGPQFAIDLNQSMNFIPNFRAQNADELRDKCDSDENFRIIWSCRKLG